MMIGLYVEGMIDGLRSFSAVYSFIFETDIRLVGVTCTAVFRSAVVIHYHHGNW